MTWTCRRASSESRNAQLPVSAASVFEPERLQRRQRHARHADVPEQLLDLLGRGVERADNLLEVLEDEETSVGEE